MKSRSTILVAFALIVGLLTAVVVFAETVIIDASGTIDSTQTTSARIFRDAIASDCVGKTFPGTFGVGGTYGYTVEGPFGPILSDSCVTVTWDPDNATAPACSTNGHPVAFLNGFDPTWGPDNVANYLGDSGSSLANTWSFPVSAGDTFVIAFMNTSSNAACNYDYSFTYEGVPDAPPEPEGCKLVIPANSVVGDAPFATQAYYEPGNIAPGVILNPGTYIVLGQDASETYYQIMLACQFLWVRKDSMQPSYEQPQNGAPLPTTIIEVAAPGEVPAGPANDF